jgi:DNA-binding transcriptional MerR regulator
VTYAYVNVRTIGRFRNVSARESVLPPDPGRAPRTTWTITELAREFDVTLRTLRHYEDIGLLHPERRGTSRVFHHRDRIRLELILRGKRLGFTLPEISTIVNMYDDQPGEAGQLQYLLDQIEVRRAELAQRRRDIEDTLGELAEVERRCREDLARLT